jgi:hypothetical protein
MQAEPVSCTYSDGRVDQWLPNILTFEAQGELADQRRRFVLLLSEALGVRLGAVTRSDSQEGTRISERLRELPEPAFLRILLAPETVHRLLWPERHRPEDIARFLARAVEAERYLCGLDSCADPPGWTAMGDDWAGPNPPGPTFKLADFPPIVLGDPAARHPLAAPEPAFDSDCPDDAALGLLTDRLTEVRQRLEATSGALWAFARDFTITLVLRGGAGNPGFRSSSPERFVGRSILWNPHAPEVTVADLAEALVHEAIHTVLDTADALIIRDQPPGTRWVTDPELYDGVSRTTSPWTGRPLDVPTYVHGSFVWFGLLCFWSRALLSNAFDPLTSRLRMLRAGAPFMNGTALHPLEPFASRIRGDVLALLRAQQADVSAQFGELTASHQAAR